jgi:hypothetical protein
VLGWQGGRIGKSRYEIWNIPELGGHIIGICHAVYAICRDTRSVEDTKVIGNAYHQICTHSVHQP